ncbi:MAG: hypothetical protein OJF59_000695 [Cytophagales bacterium]|nr:MAG: hypothetical protein OJF59_000695 [Cytophagales bacterium]
MLAKKSHGCFRTQNIHLQKNNRLFRRVLNTKNLSKNFWTIAKSFKAVQKSIDKQLNSGICAVLTD